MDHKGAWREYREGKNNVGSGMDCAKYVDMGE